jgi:hypothetical protein
VKISLVAPNFEMMLSDKYRHRASDRPTADAADAGVHIRLGGNREIDGETSTITHAK